MEGGDAVDVFEQKIVDVEQQIEYIEQQIRGVESTIKAEPNEEVKLQLRRKEEQLRNKEELLRKKEEQLREKEIIALKRMAKEDEEDGDRLAMEEEGEQPPKSKKKRINYLLDFAPSKVTWKKIVRSNLLPDFETFLHDLSIVCCREDFQLDETNDIHVAQVNKFIAENSLPMNEGYPMLVCGNMIAYLTSKLNSTRGKQSYRFSISPIVYEVPTDHRKDKQADYVILKIHNKRTIAVIELKLLVSASITAADKDHIAQLIYEAYSVCMQEGTDYENLLCIYASHDMWHFFLMDMSKVTKICKSYFSVGLGHKKLSTQNLCTIMEHYMKCFV